MSTSHVGPTIRPATTEDADAIYGLKVRAFGPTFLPFTIYRSSKSVAYLRQLITLPAQPDLQVRIRVVADAETVLGYYHAAPGAGSFFLNYIAVEKEAKRAGLGNSLLSDFETQARLLGFGKAGLDVFTSNLGVPDWYFRHDYQLREIRYQARIDLSAVSTSGRHIEWPHGEWSRALADEQRQGFAKLAGRCDEANFELGLIDGCAAKLLSWSDIALEDALAAAASTLASSRSELIVSGLRRPPSGWRFLAVEQALRLSRELQG